MLPARVVLPLVGLPAWAPIILRGRFSVFLCRIPALIIKKEGGGRTYARGERVFEVLCSLFREPRLELGLA